jgi:hypothetical protein
MWDGTIISFANDINNYNGIYVYFMESNWILQYPLSVFIIELSKFLAISYKNTNSIFVFFVMFLILNEVKLFSRDFLKFGRLAIVLVTCIFVIFPVWSVLLSSIMTLHLFCIALGLISIRFIHSKNIIKIILGYIFLVFAINFQSLLVFLPILSLFYDLNNESVLEIKSIKKIGKNSYIIFIIVFLYYFLFNKIYPPSGIYEKYNNTNNIFKSDTKELLSHIFYYLTYFVPIITILFFSIRYKLFNSKNLMLIFLSISSFIPYIIVGKSCAIWQVADWNSRQGFLLAFPVSLLFINLTKNVYHFNLKNNIRQTYLFVLMFIVMSVNFILIMIGVTYKINRQIYLDKLTILISNYQKYIPNGGRIQIIDVNQPKPVLRTYESNYLLYKATNSPYYWTKISEKVDSTFLIPDKIIKNKHYQLEYNFINKKEYSKYHTIIYIKSFKSNNILLNIFNFKNFNSIKITKISFF